MTAAVAQAPQTDVSALDIPSAPIVFTDAAAGKVAELVAEEGNPDLKLRVFVQGGGCSGFQYGFTFDELANEDDTRMEKNGVTLLIDAMRPVRDSQSQRPDHLRLRLQLLGVIGLIGLA